MKKIFYLLILLTLTACNAEVEEEKELIFNQETYVFYKEEDGYDLYTANGQVIEISYGQETILTTEIGADIYMIIGTAEDYTITKNGTTISICNGEPLTCTGFESVNFQYDFPNIIAYYEE